MSEYDLRGAHAKGSGFAPPASVSHGQHEGLPVSIMLRPQALGLPLGFFGLVAAASLVGSQAIGVLPKTASVAVGLLLIPTVVAQLVGGISSIAGWDVIAATLMLTFSGAWPGTSLIYLIQPAHGLETLAV